MRWPPGIDSVDGVCNLNEKPSGILTLEGRYPVGKNNCWHSGIHIYHAVASEVFPVIGGKLAACRIPNGDKLVPRLQRITKDEFDKLQPFEQRLYKQIGSTSAFNLKKDLSREEEEIKDEKYSNGFVLLEHTISIMAEDSSGNSVSEPLAINFFTLYQNITPAKGNTRYGVFEYLVAAKDVIPFYQKYIFSISLDAAHEIKYIVKDGKKLFPYSYCTFSENENEKYRCKFENIKGKEYEILPGDITVLENPKPKYNSRYDNVPLYKTVMTGIQSKNDQQKKRFRIASLKKDSDVFFKDSVTKHLFNGETADRDWKRAEGYFCVDIAAGDVNPPPQEWILDFFKDEYVTMTETEMNETFQGLDIPYACLQTANTERKGYLKITGSLNNGYLPYYIEGGAKIVIDMLSSGDFLEFSVKDNKCSFRYCCFLPSGIGENTDKKKNMSVLVNANDLMIAEATGYLRPGNSICGDTKKGVMVYASNNKNPFGNAIDVLEAGTEFELNDPSHFLKTWKNDKDPMLVSLKSTEPDPDRPRLSGGYLYFQKQTRYDDEFKTDIFVEQDFEIKIVHDDAYKRDEVMIPSEPAFITENELLGFSVRPPFANCAYHDFALLFNDISFFANKEKYRYQIYEVTPEMPLYELKPSEWKQYFPIGTVLTYQEFENSDRKKYYRVVIKTMPVFFQNDICQGTFAVGQEVTLTDTPTVIWLSGKMIDYLHTGSKIDDTVIYFADKFNKIRPLFKNKTLKFITDGEGGKSFTVDFSGIPQFDFVFFAPEINVPGLSVKREDNSITVGAAAELPYFRYESEAKNRKFNFLNGAHDKFTIKEIIDRRISNNEEYYGFRHGNKTTYAKSNAMESCKVNLLDWEKHFRKLDTEKSTADGCIEKAREAICEAIEHILGSEADRDGDMFYEGGGEWIRTPPDKETDEIRKNKREIICKYPLEWDKAQYLKDGKLRKELKLPFGTGNDLDRVARLENIVKALDMWEGLKGKANFLEENSFWFAHPVYFINHLDKMSVFDFNPYAGKTYGEGTPHEVTVVDNVGFAPYAMGHLRALPSGYFKPTGLFNEDFLKYHKEDKDSNGNPKIYKWYYHEGVDFGEGVEPGKSESPEIRSLIHGTVMRVGTHGLPNGRKNKENLLPDGMGDFMIVRDGKDLFKYYLLVHLAWESYKEFKIKEGIVVSPGQPVARVGHADADALKRKANYHLHVSVIRSDKFGNAGVPYELSDFPQSHVPPEQTILGTTYRFPIWHNDFKYVFLNPFDQNPDKPWKGRE